MLGDFRLHCRLVPLELDAQGSVFFAAIEGQHAVMRDLAHRLAVIEVVAIGLPFFGGGVGGRADQPAPLPGQLAGRGANLGVFADALGENVGRPCKTSAVEGSSFSGLHTPQRPQRGRRIGRCVPDRFGERLETALAGCRGAGLLLGLIGQVQVFQPLERIGPFDLLRAARGVSLPWASISRRMVAARSANCRRAVTRARTARICSSSRLPVRSLR